MRPLNLEQEMQMARAQGAAKILRDNLTTLENIAHNGFCGTPEAFERYMRELGCDRKPTAEQIRKGQASVTSLH